MTKLICSDMDGTLIDTDIAVYLSYKKALEGYNNVKFTLDYYKEHCKGKTYRDFLPYFLDKVEDIETVHNKKMEAYRGFINKSALNESLISMMSAFKAAGAKLALVTTATKKNCYEALEEFSLDKFFDLIITQEDVKRNKPHPDCYLKAMEHFNISPKETIIFEDSDVGIEAAEKSGATVYAVKQFN